MEPNEDASSSCPMGETAQEKGMSHVPKCYMVPNSEKPSLNPEIACVPLIDLAGLEEHRRGVIVENIKNACKRYGFFQIINHGIDQHVLDEALSSAFEFFKLPSKEKAKYMSNDVHAPTRYGSSLKDGEDKIQYWRVFLKHYANPLHDWVHLWPHNPSTYRENMGKFAVEVQKISYKIMGAIIESLGIEPTHYQEKLDKGMQVMAVNCYPPCPQPELALGLPSHSDYSILTILLQSQRGLEIFDKEDEKWRAVSEIKGALQVHVGDHLEVLSNGKYKSVAHRVTLDKERTRVSIASLHSLGLDEQMEVAKELVDEDHPRLYKANSFRDFLKFLANNDFGGKSFLETLKIG